MEKVLIIGKIIQIIKQNTKELGIYLLYIRTLY